MSFNLLQGKTALITGASKGIGAEIATQFAMNGANLILLARDVQKLEELKLKIVQQFNVEVYVYSVDVADINQIKEAFAQISTLKIGIDCLVNNAGVMQDATLMMMKPDTLQSNINTNLIGTINVSQACLKLIIKQRKGSIINLSSIIGTNGNAGQSAYSASKSGVIGFTKSISKELAPLNIRVNAIAPGYIETDLTSGQTEQVKEKTIKNIGMRRFGTTKDVANLAVFLASDQSEYITGQVIGVDGGMII